MTRLHAIACAVSEALAAFNRNPVTIICFPVATLAFIAVGWMVGKVELFLLIETTLLSIDASWTNRLQLLKQAQQAGEEDAP